LRIITIILLLTLFTCKKSISQEKEVTIEQTENQNSAEKIALDFINKYVEYCNNRNSEQELIEWISEQKNVTGNFKIELKRIISEAEKKEPELGLGFDPIFDAQDYPDDGFETEKFNKHSELVTVKAKNWSDYKLNIKVERKNEQWLVNGIGIINMSEKENPRTQNRNYSYTKPLCFILNQPHILALSVFANTKFQRSKNQKS